MRGSRVHKGQLSNRRVRQREPQLREELLAATLRYVGEAIMSSDSRGRITSANPAAEQLLERGTSELDGELLREVLPLRTLDGKALASDPFDLVHHTGQPVRFEATIDGLKQRHVVAGTVAAVRSGAEDLGLVLALRDVTELLDTRQHLEFSERLASLGTLASGVAHEVNNPLAVVISSVGYALDVGSPDKAVTEALTDARDAATRVAHIIESLRDFSRPDADALKALDPREAFGTALHLTHAQWRTFAGVLLELGPVPLVMAAPTRLAQVMVSLVINAVQSMEPLGDNRLLTLSSRTDARGWAVLSVTDDGPGVEPAVARRIFDPFFTTRAPGAGSGLGLSISRSIVEHHKGELTIDTPEGGVGARFNVFLPPANQSAPTPTPLQMWWVGPSTPESAVLCPGKELAFSEDLSPTIGADLLLLNVSVDGLTALHDKHPDLDLRGLLVNQRPPPGLRSVSTSNLDPQGLVALVRRGR